MSIPIRAIYEKGKFRLLDPLDLEEHAVVRISVEPAGDEAERREWLEQGRRSLMQTWDNEADDVYNALLSQ